nr:putative holin [Ottowia beijingensis]
MPDLLNLFSRRWRMTDWLLVALGLALLVWLMAPQQLPVSVYKLSLVAMAAVAGYWIDRSLFPTRGRTAFRPTRTTPRRCRRRAVPSAAPTTCACLAW